MLLGAHHLLEAGDALIDNALDLLHLRGGVLGELVNDLRLLVKLDDLMVIHGVLIHLEVVHLVLIIVIMVFDDLDDVGGVFELHGVVGVILNHGGLMDGITHS